MRFLSTIWQKFLTVFGRIKIFPWPLFVVYDPTTFKAHGAQFREALAVIKPGYVIGRGYDNYIDGFFIPGAYSHTCVVAKVTADEQTVIHSMAFGVFEQDLIDFLRCDRFVIFKPRNGAPAAAKKARSLIGSEYDFKFKANNGKYYCHEMTAACFPKLDIKRVQPAILGVAVGEPVYTIDSFIKSKDFEVIYEYNPKEEKFGAIKD